MKLQDPWRWLAVAAAAGTLALGLVVDLPLSTPQRRKPVWAAHLEPLRAAPLPSGAPVALVLPPGLEGEDTKKLVMETVWQRPEVRWVRAADLPSGAQIVDAVVLAPRAEVLATPPGWREVWSRGWVRLFRWVKP